MIRSEEDKMDVYLDNSATTMPYEEVTRKVTEMMTSFGEIPLRSMPAA